MVNSKLPWDVAPKSWPPSRAPLASTTMETTKQSSAALTRNGQAGSKSVIRTQSVQKKDVSLGGAADAQILLPAGRPSLRPSGRVVMPRGAKSCSRYRKPVLTFRHRRRAASAVADLPWRRVKTQTGSRARDSPEPTCPEKFPYQSPHITNQQLFGSTAKVESVWLKRNDIDSLLNRAMLKSASVQMFGRS